MGHRDRGSEEGIADSWKIKEIRGMNPVDAPRLVPDIAMFLWRGLARCSGKVVSVLAYPVNYW